VGKITTICLFGIWGEGIAESANVYAADIPVEILMRRLVTWISLLVPVRDVRQENLPNIRISELPWLLLLGNAVPTCSVNPRHKNSGGIELWCYCFTCLVWLSTSWQRIHSIIIAALKFAFLCGEEQL
jgi:hypothetical protein